MISACYPYLAVDLEPDITLSTTLDDWTNSHETDNEGLALLDVDHHLLPNIRTGKEVASRHNAQVAILLDEALVLLEDLFGKHERMSLAFTAKPD